MTANETRVVDFLSANKKQFVIPVYQRNYDWTQKQCKQLLDDIVSVGRDDGLKAHFIGSIVFVHDDIYVVAKLQELTIIDGQQRLTTLTLIYLALMHLAKDMGDEAMQDEIRDTFLTNKYAAEGDKLKLRPTENNEKALKYIYRGDATEEYQGFSKLVENYKYFRLAINKDNYAEVLRGLDKLVFVQISLERGKDDPQRIFESLNSTGLELSQADLIRNFILMGLRREEQARIYRSYWEVIENLAKDEISNTSRISDFIRDYLTFINKKIPNKSGVYEAFKERYGNKEELESVLAELKRLSKHYNRLLNPSKELDKDVQRQLRYIDQLEINVAYPFLIKVYDDYDRGEIDKATFISVLELIQSFTWRRFILSLPTSALNKIFMTLYEKIQPTEYLKSLQKWLLERTGSQRFPKDNEVVETLRDKDMYNAKSKNRMYFFERMENFQNPEYVSVSGNDSITIEHIFPQKPSPKWIADLGKEQSDAIKERYLNTIANLTLSGNNGKLGNRPFLEKRDLPEAGYRDSRLWLNRYLSGIDDWNIAALEQRFELLKERFLKIWPYPNVPVEPQDESYTEVNIFEAEEPKYKRLEYVVFMDERLEVKNVAALYREVMRRLFDLEPERFFSTDLKDKVGLVSLSEKGKLRQAEALSETQFIEANIDSNGKFERIRYALRCFNLEDELSIKYADK